MQRDPKAIARIVEAAWLGVIAQNADAKTWDALHRMAAGARSATERSIYYALLGSAKNDALARRALDLAIARSLARRSAPA